MSTEDKKIIEDYKKDLRAIGLDAEADKLESLSKAPEDEKPQEEKAKEEEVKETPKPKPVEEDEEESKPAPRKKSEDEETSKEDEETEAKEDDSEEEDTRTPKDFIPKRQHNRQKARWATKEQTYLDTIAELNTKLEEYNSAKTEAKKDAIDEDVKSLANELNIPEEQLAKIIKVARKGVELPPETLKDIQEAKEMARLRKEAEYFETEWSALLPEVKSKFPNASPEKIEEAKKLMDKYSHSEKLHVYDLDYILFKKQEDFEKILTAPTKKKTFESGKLSAREEMQKKPFDPTKMSRKEIEEFEKEWRQDNATNDMEVHDQYGNKLGTI